MHSRSFVLGVASLAVVVILAGAAFLVVDARSNDDDACANQLHPERGFACHPKCVRVADLDARHDCIANERGEISRREAMVAVMQAVSEKCPREGSVLSQRTDMHSMYRELPNRWVIYDGERAGTLDIPQGQIQFFVYPKTSRVEGVTPLTESWLNGSAAICRLR